MGWKEAPSIEQFASTIVCAAWITDCTQRIIKQENAIQDVQGLRDAREEESESDVTA